MLVIVRFCAFSGVGFFALILIASFALTLAFSASHKVSPMIVEYAAFLAAVEAMLHFGSHVFLLSGLPLRTRFVAHLLILRIRVAPTAPAFSSTAIRLPSAATFPRCDAAELATVIVRVVGFPVVVCHFFLSGLL